MLTDDIATQQQQQQQQYAEAQQLQQHFLCMHINSLLQKKMISRSADQPATNFNKEHDDLDDNNTTEEGSAKDVDNETIPDIEFDFEDDPNSDDWGAINTIPIY